MSAWSDMDTSSLIHELVLFLQHNAGRSFNYKQICAALELQDPEDREQVRKLLKKLTEDKTILEVSEGKYTIPKSVYYVTGIIEFYGPTRAIVTDQISGREISVPSESLGKSLHGDTVKVKITREKKGKLFGEVVEILRRGRKEFVGIVSRNKHSCFVIPDFHRMYVDFYIPSGKTMNARDGDKVLVELKEWKEDDPNPTGHIRHIFGKSGEHQAEMHAIMAEFGLNPDFGDEVMYFARRVPDSIFPEEEKNRIDFRPYLTFTIDPEDAKDFDDALSYRKTEDGLEEVGIHIADVSHYVKPDTPLDREAYRRGTSVYLVDRCIPMLPERLSNHICSLNPHEDRLCFSVIVYFDQKGNIIRHHFSKTIIRSKKRFTYEEVQDILEHKRKDAGFDTVLFRLDMLAKKLRKERESMGSLFFDREEVKFRLDDKGNPVEVYFKTSKDAHKLIEDFMLLANRLVAEFLGKPPSVPEKGIRKEDYWCIYRIHEVPSEEKLLQLKDFLSRINVPLKVHDRASTAQALNDMLRSIQHRKEKNTIELLTIRSMPKAIYTTVHDGHYGLGFEYYCHFTSPIRRYPDLMTHRLLELRLQKKPFPPRSYYEEYCKHCSEREKNAAEAERASVRYKQMEYLADRVGQVFKGMISGVTEWGIYVELYENKCEGMIRKSDLPGDYYVFDEDHLRYIGRKTRRTFTLGDDIFVLINRVNVVERKADFLPVEDNFMLSAFSPSSRNGKKKKSKKDKKRKK